MFQLGSLPNCNYPVRDKCYRNEQIGHTRLVQRRCLQREDGDKSVNGFSWRAASMGVAAGAAIALSAFGAFASEAPLLVIPNSSSVSAGPAKYVVLERRRVENLLTKEFATGLAELTDDDLLNMLEDVLSSRSPSNASSMWDRVTEYSPQRPVELTSASKQAPAAVSRPPTTSESTSDSKSSMLGDSPSVVDGDSNTKQSRRRDSHPSGAVSAEPTGASPMIPSLSFLTPTPLADEAPTRQDAANEEATQSAVAATDASVSSLVAPSAPITPTGALDPTSATTPPANNDSADASSQPEAALADALTWVTSNLQQALQAAVPTADPQEQQPVTSSGAEVEGELSAPGDQISSFIAPVSSAVAAAVQTVGPPLEEGLSAVRDRAADVWTDIAERTASSSMEDPDMLGAIVGAAVLGTVGIAVLYREQLEETDPAPQDSQSSANSAAGSAAGSTPAQQQQAALSGSPSAETKLAGGAANSKLAAESRSDVNESSTSGSERSRLQRLLDNGPVVDLPSMATAPEETGLPLTPPPPPPPSAAAFSSSAAEGSRVLWRRREEPAEPAGASSGGGVLWRRSAQPDVRSGASAWAARLSQQQPQQQHGSAAPASIPAWQANTALPGTKPASNSSDVYDMIPDPWKLPKQTAGQSAGAEQAGSIGGGLVSEGASDRGGQ